tara:strand:- start:1557 stop:2015 length:459 start_codon:yes stop_codon:yes gene_type:complete
MEKETISPKLEGVLKGIVKLKCIMPEWVLNKLEEQKASNLTTMDETYRHITIMNSKSTKDLRQRIKSQEHVIQWPEYPFLNLPAAKVEHVEDAEKGRETCRLTFNVKDQIRLHEWRKEFCRINNVILPKEELNRVFHMSYANLTGKPGDSVA